MRVLFLDDDRQRFIQFTDIILELTKRKEIGELDVKWAMNAQMARTFLEEYLTFDVAFLDHDLAPEHYGNPPEVDRVAPADGRAVAHFIAAMPKEDQPWMCHVHSWNYPASKEMESILGDAKVHTTRAMFPKGIHDVLAAVWAIRGKKV